MGKNNRKSCTTNLSQESKVTAADSAKSILAAQDTNNK